MNQNINALGRKAPFAASLLAVFLLLALTACGKPGVATRQTEDAQAAAQEKAESTQEAWKTALGEELFQKYGILPEHFEHLGGGTYQVYAEVGGEVIPVVTIDSATGEYHWNEEDG